MGSWLLDRLDHAGIQILAAIAIVAAISAAWLLLKYGFRRLAWLHGFWGEGEDP